MLASPASESTDSAHQFRAFENRLSVCSKINSTFSSGAPSVSINTQRATPQASDRAEVSHTSEKVFTDFLTENTNFLHDRRQSLLTSRVNGFSLPRLILTKEVDFTIVCCLSGVQ